MTAAAARVREVEKRYRSGVFAVRALDAVDLIVPQRSFTAVVGPSGSGKSTLLHLLGCIDTPDKGSIEIDGRDVGRLDDDKRSAFRAKHIGFVFQTFNLMPMLSALENVEYPLRLLGLPRAQRVQEARQTLGAVGLEGLEDRFPAELSGGQRQRVAIARALVKRPALVLADEPTANLDQRTGTEILSLLRALQRERGTTVVCCSHDPQLIESADGVVSIVDGRVQPDGRSV